MSARATSARCARQSAVNHRRAAGRDHQHAVALTLHLVVQIDAHHGVGPQLGGTVGTLSPITIGTYGKKNEYRVNTTGGTRLGGSSSAIPGVAYFASGDEGAAAALAYSIKLEVERGAIEGLDAAREDGSVVVPTERLESVAPTRHALSTD